MLLGSITGSNNPKDAKTLADIPHNFNSCGPAMRDYLLERALKSYKESYIPGSIFYTTEALNISTRLKYPLSSTTKHLTEESMNFAFWKRSEISLDSKTADEPSSDDFIEFCKRKLKDKENKTSNSKVSVSVLNPVNVNYEPNVEDGFNKIVEKCRQLPTEWTVIQINKEYNPRNSFSRQKEIFTANGKIFLTLFCYPRSELLDHNPIMLCIDVPRMTTGNIFEELHNVFENIAMKLEVNVEKSIYWNHQHKIEDLLKGSHDSLKKVLGPWITLFNGKSMASSAMEEWDKSVFKLVDESIMGVQKNKLEATQKVLLSLICRRIDLVTDLNAAAKLITPDPLMLLRTVKLFSEVKKRMALKEFDQNPCLLIVDEHLDQFKWEMQLPEQPFSRCTSLHSLLNLYYAWKEAISDGYIKKTMEEGSCIVNPDKDLKNMELRLRQFFEYWQPNWKLLGGRIPKSEEIVEMLSTSGIFIYSGHGSGLQYISPSQLVKLSINCPVFLFGCQSVALKSPGWKGEMTGTHHFYHLALCPSIVGMLHPVTDMDTDTMTTDIITQWIPSSVGNVWSTIDMDKWRKGSLVLKSSSSRATKAASKNCSNPTHRSLLKVISNERCNAKHTLRMRTAVVCRGLPMYNQIYEVSK